MSGITIAQYSMQYTDCALALESEDPFRNHFGASNIGKKCPRAIWYDWRWYTLKIHEPRMKRLFAYGHKAEETQAEYLEKGGIQVRTIDQNTGKQFRFLGYKGHEAGSVDGFAWNVPDVPVGQWTLWENKTHNDKNFKNISKVNAQGFNVGLIEYKYEHYAQCQRYMDAFGLHWTLYTAENKNDDARLMLIIPYVPEHAAQIKERAIMLVDMTEPPKRISTLATGYPCKMCDHNEMCQQGAAPHRSCRSCIYVRAIDNGQWQCLHTSHPYLLDNDRQRQGCGDYTVNH